MATAIYFNARRINLPGAYSKIDASALAGISFGAVGVVALIGVAEGGRPQTIDPEFADLTRPEQARSRFRGGLMRIAAEFAFAPSQDESIPGGAQRIVAVKVNPSTGSAATLSDANANDSVVVTSRDSGQFTEQINVLVEAGTTQGKAVTIAFEDTVESFDDIGGSPIMDLLYTPGSNGYGTATGRVTSTAFEVAATKTASGMDDEITVQLGGATALLVTSNNAADTSQSVTIYGLNAANEPIKETLALNGTANVTGSVSFTLITAVRMSAAATGTVLVRNSGDTTTHVTLTAGQVARGVEVTTATPAGGVVTISANANLAGENVVVRGLGASGQEVAERFSLATASTTPVVGTVTFTRITQIELGDAAAAQTVTATLNAFRTTHAVFPTLQRVTDKLNALPEFTANALAAAPTTFLMADADYADPVSIMGSAGEFSAENYAIVREINLKSGLVTAARASGAVAGPANTADPVFLTGGSEGSPTVTDWQTCFDLLKKRRVNIVVPLTDDPAVHAMLLAHLKWRAGEGRTEANGYVGLGDGSGGGETRSAIKTEIQALQNRNISAIAEEVQRADPLTGASTWYPPHVLAAIAAGMQAGSPIGEPLTHKLIACSDIRQHTSWDPTEDGSEMIDAGLMVAEKVENVGIRWLRSITTHIADDNLAYVEMSANESMNTAVFELRTRLEKMFTGKRGLGATAGAMKGKARAILEELVESEIIFDFKPESLSVEQIGDVFPISVELSPIGPINFIPITVHVTTPVAQAA